MTRNEIEKFYESELVGTSCSITILEKLCAIQESITKQEIIEKACQEFCYNCRKPFICITPKKGFATDKCKEYQSFRKTLEE